MAKLALLGGQPVFDKTLHWKTIWPPVDDGTERKLLELYRSRLWSAFDDTEGLFTKAFAHHHGARHGVFMVNGTVTLQCALAAYGIGPGDEVIVPPLTWYATAMAPHYLGARPVFVDVKQDTLCIDPEKVERAITERTKAIIPVHVFGSVADMDRIMEIARAHHLRVIEDCAHAHGGVWEGRGIGTIGDVGSFSFQQSKTLASGEGGICITNDAELAERIFRIKHIGYGPGQLQGQAKDTPPQGLLCHNFRATAFQALLLTEQLKSLNSRLDSYKKAVSYLEHRLTQSTRVRFQTRPEKVQRQGYYALAMIFDHPEYTDIPLSVIEKAITAEGQWVYAPWGPVYRFTLFNLRPEAYRIDQPCTVAERVGGRVLCLLHAYLGLGESYLEKIAAAIEKVMSNADQLRAYAS